MRRRRRRTSGDDVNVDRWLITYADLITILLAFFVLLYAMSQIDVARFESIARSLSVQFTSDPSLIDLGNRADIERNPADYEGLDIGQLDQEEKDGDGSSQTDAELDALYAKIRQYVVENDLETDVRVENARRGVEITFAEHVLFDLGRAELKRQSREVLEPLVPLLNELNNPISVEGHTDNLPIVSGNYESNWELSTARSLSVLSYLEDEGIASKRLALVGYGEHKPIKPNDTDDNRQFNRRVNLVILR
mgnify:CR=1 FL=1